MLNGLNCYAARLTVFTVRTFQSGNPNALGLRTKLGFRRLGHDLSSTMKNDSQYEDADSGLCFAKPPPHQANVPTKFLYVANCGPAVGLSIDSIRDVFKKFGAVQGVYKADGSGNRMVIEYSAEADAIAAKDALNGRPCDDLHGCIPVIQFSIPRQTAIAVTKHAVQVHKTALDVGIPGLFLHNDFISREEEQDLIAAVDGRPWMPLAKRRVQHYGYEFLYKVRNVDTTRKMGDLPGFVDFVVCRMNCLEELADSAKNYLPFDQLTVNEYPRGVGLSPHVDTHSAFEGAIVSLSLASSCVMEFRKYESNPELESEGLLHNNDDRSAKETDSKVRCERRALLLPERSLLILSGEARYAWHHYIYHHKVDIVNDQIMPRSPRRVSLTFRKVRVGDCVCGFPQYCDSQTLNVISAIPGVEKPEENVFTEANSLSLELKDKASEDNDILHIEHLHAVAGSDGPSYVTSDTMLDFGVCNNHYGIVKENGNVTQFTSAETQGNSCPSHSTPEIEKTFVHKVYDAIAPHFHSTRFAKWPKVADFLYSLDKGSVILDAGCGNGKYLGLNSNCFFIGCDISAPLISICSQRGHEVLVADALILPFRAGFFDAAISIAVLHHLSTEERRCKAIVELLRVIRPGGKILITVWAVEQEDASLLKKWTPLDCSYMEQWVGDMKHDKKRNTQETSLEKINEGLDGVDSIASTELSEGTDQQEYFVPWHLPYHRAEIGGASVAAVASGYAKKDDKKGAVVYNRYYHVFAEGELERLVSRLDGVLIVDRFYDKSNWCVILGKKGT